MNASEAPFRRVPLGPRETIIERRAGGEILMRSPHALGDYPRTLTDRFAHWAEAVPDRRFIARRGPDGAWIALDYATAWAKVRSIAQALLDRGLSAERS